MAVDWWLLNHSSQPVLRIYSWAEATLSIGYRQQFEPPPVLSRLVQNYPVVVRPTGGGYLLHADELTFSLSIPPHHRLAETEIMELYELTCRSFQRTLKKLGLTALPGTSRNTSAGNPVSCLAAPERHEPVLQGKKWLAAAQVRHRGSILEQGSLFWSENNWPDNDLLDLPFFISNNIDVDKQEFLQVLLPEAIATLDLSSIEIRGITSAEWRGIRNEASRFEVNSPEELPVFRRFSRQPDREE